MTDLDIITADLRHPAPRSEREHGFNEGVDRLAARVAELRDVANRRASELDDDGDRLPGQRFAEGRADAFDQVLDLLAATPASDGLDVAWKAADEAREAWRLLGVSWPTERDDEWVAWAGGEGTVLRETGPTPVAALRALAARLSPSEGGESR